mmetsp:Transcript_74987/g.219661  ORF Transcript_74987/g.219661 Transcript_74987/m.219661 type:complete len:271 (+) Transcript_74987:150-962(+)
MKPVTEITNEQMMQAAAALRAEARASELASKELPPKPQGTALTVGEALSEMAATMQADKFWSEMAAPLESSRAAIEAGTDAERERAVLLLKDLRSQLEELKRGEVVMFVREKEVLDALLALLEGSPAVTLETVVSGMHYERSTGHGTNTPLGAKAQELVAKGGQVLKNFPMNPWEFREVQNQVEVTVTIRVPPDTMKKDIKVTIQPTFLSVAIRGHERQPHVIYGDLSGPIDVDGSGWHLDGSGEGRTLVVDLEKTMGGIEWHSLLKADM